MQTMLKASPHNSRFILVLCAFCGFALCLMTSLAARTDANTALIRGTIGLAAGALLGKYFLSVLYSVSREMRSIKRKRQDELRRAREAQEALEEDEMLS